MGGVLRYGPIRMPGAQYLRMRIDCAMPYFATSCSVARASIAYSNQLWRLHLLNRSPWRSYKVSGAAFLMLTERNINELVPSVGLRPQIRAILKGSNKVWIYLTSHVY